MKRATSKAHHPPSAFAQWAEFALKRTRPRVAVLPDFASPPPKPRKEKRKARRRARRA
jgi:hypothetical protein